MIMFRQPERGSAAVEFAMVVPLLVMLVIGISQFGRAYNVQTTLSSAARMGARVMAVKNDQAAARTAAKAAATSITLTDSQIAITPTSCAYTATTPASTGTATVVISYPFTFLGGGFLSGTITIKGTGVMRCGG